MIIEKGVGGGGSPRGVFVRFPLYTERERRENRGKREGERENLEREREMSTQEGFQGANGAFLFFSCDFYYGYNTQFRLESVGWGGERERERESRERERERDNERERERKRPLREPAPWPRIIVTRGVCISA